MTGVYLYLALAIAQNHCSNISKIASKLLYANCVVATYECMKKTNIQSPKLECLK